MSCTNWLLFAFLSLNCSIPLALAEDRAEPREEVLQLMYRNDGYLSLDELNDWRNEISSRPDIKPDLLEALRRAYEMEKNGERAGMALSALGQRKDLTEEELDEVLRPLVAQKDVKALDQLHEFYAYAGLQVLKSYPSVDHEKLAIAYLSRPEFLSRMGAARVLADIGTEPSLAPMRQLATAMKPAEGISDDDYDIVQKAITSIEKRMDESGAGEPAIEKSHASTLPPPEPIISRPDAAGDPAAHDASEPTKEKIALAGVVAFAFIAFVVLMIRLRRHRSSS